MLDQQLAAAFIAAVLLVIGVGAVIRSTSIYVAVAFGLLAGIPFLALVTYAIAPRPTQDLGVLVNLALVPALIALGAGSYAVAASINRAPLLRSRSIHPPSPPLLRQPLSVTSVDPSPARCSRRDRD